MPNEAETENLALQICGVSIDEMQRESGSIH
jgi:hypothetical protein